MTVRANIDLNTVLTLIFLALLSYFLVVYNWRRRWLYYYGSKLAGPSSWPLIGSAFIFICRYEDLYQKIMSVCERNPPLFKVWLGSELIIANSTPEDLEVILNTFLDKGPLYQTFLGDVLKDGLLTGRLGIWKRHRKIINPTFNQKTLTSFLDIFTRRSNQLLVVLDARCGKGQFDVTPHIWKCALNITCESMGDLDADLISGQDEYIANMTRLQQMIVTRGRNPLLHPEVLWSMSSLGKEWTKLCGETFDFCRQIIDAKAAKLDELNEMDDEDVRKKRFLNYLNILKNGNVEFTEEEMLEEMQTMMIASSETAAVVDSVLLCILGIHQDVQDKVYQELHSIFGGSLREPTADDLNRMEYLERVIKESMRLFPAAPIIMRYIDKDVEINNNFYPKGSNVAIPIMYLHRKKELWDDPFSFNPDRFLPENAEKRHRCAYMPFSFGPRGCIGFRYAMLAMKVILSNILRNYRIVSSYYKSLDDIKLLLYAAVAKPVHDSPIEIERRNGLK